MLMMKCRVKGAWLAGRCPVIGWFVGCRSSEEKNWRENNRSVCKDIMNMCVRIYIINYLNLTCH